MVFFYGSPRNPHGFIWSPPGRSQTVADNVESAAAHGKYLAQTTCSECHGPDLHGWGDDDAPPGLAIVAAYPAVALERFSYYTPDEIRAMHAYLTSDEFYALQPRDRAARQ
jgi:mono/diheme cytochrome c family protein